MKASNVIRYLCGPRMNSKSDVGLKSKPDEKYFKTCRFKTKNLDWIGPVFTTTTYIRRCYLAGKFWMKCKSIKSNSIVIDLVENQSNNINSWNRKKKPFYVMLSKFWNVFWIVWVTYIDLSLIIITNIHSIHRAKRQYNVENWKNTCCMHSVLPSIYSYNWLYNLTSRVILYFSTKSISTSIK